MAKNRINNDQRNDFDEFHETMSPAASRGYQPVTTRDTNAAAAGTGAEQVVRTIATILSVLLGLRFLTHLFSDNTANGFITFVDTMTNWMTAPFQGLASNTTAGPNGYFDLPAIAAIVAIMVIAYLVNRLIRTARRGNEFQ